MIYSRELGNGAMGDPKRPTEPPPSQDAILTHLRNIAREQLGLKAEQVERIDLETDVVEGLDLDSLAQVVLITQLEEHYDFVFTLEDREQLQTVQKVRDLVRLVQRATEGATSS